MTDYIKIGGIVHATDVRMRDGRLVRHFEPPEEIRISGTNFVVTPCSCMSEECGDRRG